MIPALLPGIGELEAMELYLAEPSLLGGIEAAVGRRTTRRVVFVRIVTTQAEGWGELAAMDGPVGRDPSLAAAVEALDGPWRGRLAAAASSRAGSCPPSHVVESLGGGTAADRMAGAAIEMALLDAELRADGRSMARWLDRQETEVAFGALLGIPASRDLDDLVSAGSAAVDEGASRLRVKVAPGWAAEPMAALRRELPGTLLQADANASLEGAAGRAELDAMDQLGLSCIEEPISGFDLAAAWALSQELETPVCLDESLVSHRAVRDAIRYGACRTFCIKPGRLGGIRAALRSLDEIAGSGLSAFIGGMHEAGLGRAANGVLSLHPACGLVSDVVAPSTYLDQDPCGLPGPAGGAQPLHLGPGIGPWPERALVGPL